MGAGLLQGSCVGLGTTLVLAMLTAKLVDMGTLRVTAIGYCAIGILLASSFLSAVIATGRIKRQKMLVCGISGLIYYCILLGMTALFFDGQYRGMGVTALMVVCGVGLAVLTVNRQGRGAGKGKRRKHPYR